MTREQAIAEAQRRNVAAYQRTGALESVWAEVEIGGGEWDIALCEKVRRPLWRRVTRSAVDWMLEPDPEQSGLLADPPRHRWRMRRRSS